MSAISLAVRKPTRAKIIPPTKSAKAGMKANTPTPSAVAAASIFPSALAAKTNPPTATSHPIPKTINPTAHINGLLVKDHTLHSS
jgi:hypothetical protein